MNLSALHAAVRDDLRKGADPTLAESLGPDMHRATRLSAAERAAIASWRRHVRHAGGGVGRLIPPLGTLLVWMVIPAERDK